MLTVFVNDVGLQPRPDCPAVCAGHPYRVSKFVGHPPVLFVHRSVTDVYASTSRCIPICSASNSARGSSAICTAAGSHCPKGATLQNIMKTHQAKVAKAAKSDVDGSLAFMLELSLLGQNENVSAKPSLLQSSTGVGCVTSMLACINCEFVCWLVDMLQL